MDKMMNEWVKLIHHDANCTCWTERQKNASALRAKYENDGTFPIDNFKAHDRIKN
jgi:hypothetical protein